MDFTNCLKLFRIKIAAGRKKVIFFLWGGRAFSFVVSPPVCVSMSFLLPPSSHQINHKITSEKRGLMEWNKRKKSIHLFSQISHKESYGPVGFL
jgi:hypothetical protein